jgi:hypothetical protein
VVDLRDELDGYTVSFTSLLVDIDATPFMKGLPDDRCQCPHWGYVFKGKMTARYADRESAASRARLLELQTIGSRLRCQFVREAQVRAIKRKTKRALAN